jgi:putative cell wall-binding protein
MPRFAVVAIAVLLVLPAAGAQEQEEADCPDLSGFEVLGAEFTQTRCLDDLTTYRNPYTDTTPNAGGGTRDNGAIHSDHTEFPEVEVPGIQVEGWFPDSCDRYQPETTTFMPPCDNGLRRNGQFVIRVPNDWDGETLVVAGTPGIRAQFSSDMILSDWVLMKGWAYAAQDKGNTAVNFFRAGDDETDGSLTHWVPGKAMEQWAEMMGTTARAAQDLLERVHGNAPARTYASGISNGGYQTRLAIERFPELYDGGVDWEGHPMLAEGPNLYTYIPAILRAYPAYKAGSEEAYQTIVHEGRLPPPSEPIWDHHWVNYYGITPTVYRPAIDPEYTGYVTTPSFVVPPGHPDAEYDYHERPEFVRERMERLQVVGETHGKPLIIVHPDLDALVPISTASDPYAERIRAHGHGDALRYYVVEGATHVDSLADSHPDTMRAALPCYLDAIDALDAWVRSEAEPPPSGLVPFPADQTPAERANACDLPAPVERVAGESRIETAVEASRRIFGIAKSAVIASARDYPDALAAAPLAARLEAPVLLVGDELEDAVAHELWRIGAVEAVVVGGPAAVSEDVDGELADLGLEVRRVAGGDRYETAAEVAAEVGFERGEAYVASGVEFADALAAAAVAAGEQVPILLTAPDRVPEPTRELLAGLARTWVVGGPRAVAERAAADLPNPTRLAGPDRYATSLAVADHGLRRGASSEHVLVASGRTFPDALAGGPLAALGPRGGVGRGLVVLTDPRDPGPAATWLAGQAVRQAMVLGGTQALPASVDAQLRRALGAEE